MNKLLALLACLFLLAGGYYFLLYPPMVHQRAAQRLLDELGATVEKQNAADIKQLLDAKLARSAQVELEVHLPSATPDETGAVKQPFTKPEFLGFVDNTLYSLKEYHLKAKVESLKLSADRTTGTLTFSALMGATDNLEVSLHLSGQSRCTAELAYASGSPPVIQQMSCVVELKYGLR